MNWLAGYKQNAGNGSFLVDYGDCGGCPPDAEAATVSPDSTATFFKGWTVRNVWKRIEDITPSRVQPEIYAVTGDNARSWETVAEWGWVTFGKKMNFRGTLTQQAAVAYDCRIPSSPSCQQAQGKTDNSPVTGFTQLWRALNGDPQFMQHTVPAGIAQTLRYSSDIDWYR